MNKEIIADGLKPKRTTFQTQKQSLRNAIDTVSEIAKSWEEFEDELSEKYDITVRVNRGQVGYRIDGRNKSITERSLGTNYGYAYLTEQFERNLLAASRSETDYHKNRYVIFHFKSDLRLVVDLQQCVKSQNPYYARKVKISNLQQMADTLIYVQDHNYDTRTQIQNELSTLRGQLDHEQQKLSALQTELRSINEQIRYNGQYYGNKKIYQEMIHAPNKGAFRKEHASEIAAFEEAHAYRNHLYPDKNFPKANELKERKQQLQNLIKRQKDAIYELGNREKELNIASENVDAMLDLQPVAEQKNTREEELS